jgi:hypothetical protein
MMVKKCLMTCILYLQFIIPYHVAYGQDPGQPDEVLVGNLNGSPTLAELGGIVNVPVWIKNDEDVAAVQIPIATEDEFVSGRLGGNYFYPFTEWDDPGFCCVVPDQPIIGYTTEGFLGIKELYPPYVSPPLNTSGSFLKVLEFTLQIGNDQSLLGDSTLLIEGYVPYWSGGLLFVDSVSNSWIPLFSEGKLVIVEPGSLGCDYEVGDVNNSTSYNGLDITYGVAYFKGGNPPLYQCECTPGNTWYVSGDVNGDCAYNGLDIGYGVNYLKGGSAPNPCPDCPPTI